MAHLTLPCYDYLVLYSIQSAGSCHLLFRGTCSPSLNLGSFIWMESNQDGCIWEFRWPHIVLNFLGNSVIKVATNRTKIDVIWLHKVFVHNLHSLTSHNIHTIKQCRRANAAFLHSNWWMSVWKLTLNKIKHRPTA